MIPINLLLPPEYLQYVVGIARSGNHANRSVALRAIIREHARSAGVDLEPAISPYKKVTFRATPYHLLSLNLVFKNTSSASSGLREVLRATLPLLVAEDRNKNLMPVKHSADLKQVTCNVRHASWEKLSTLASRPLCEWLWLAIDLYHEAHPDLSNEVAMILSGHTGQMTATEARRLVREYREKSHVELGDDKEPS